MGGDTSSPIGAIVRILNNQLQALTQVCVRGRSRLGIVWDVEGIVNNQLQTLTQLCRSTFGCVAPPAPPLPCTG